MGLGRFFAPKTQHADPAVRRDAVGALAPGDDEVHRLAAGDPDEGVRTAAIARVLAFDVLEACLSDAAATAAVRDAARNRWHALVAGAVEEAPAAADRIGELKRRGDTDQCLHVARVADLMELRLAAVQRLTGPEAAPDTRIQAVLADIAIGDASAEVRLAAANGVHEAEQLERIAHDTRKRDKRVHKLARERVHGLREAADHRLAIDQLCATITALDESLDTEAEPGPSVAAALNTLEEQWHERQGCGLPIDEADSTRFETAAASIRRRVEAANERQARLAHTLDALRALEASLSNPKAADTSPEQLASRLSALEGAWSEAGDASPEQAREYAALRRHIDDVRRHRARDAERVEAANDLLERAQRRVDDKKALGPKDVKALDKRWSALRLPEDKATAAALRDRYATVRDRTTARIVAQREDRERRIDEIAGLIERMETSLADGKLADAISCHDKARHRLRDRDLPRGPVDKLTRRLHKHESRIAELRKWRHFGTDVARERLCEKAQALVDDTQTAPADMAQRVRELRKQWQRLDRTDGPAASGLWERFDQLCEAAYAPSQAWFDEQSKNREANLEKRRAICDRLDALVSDTDWAQADFRQVNQALREAEKQWRHAGPVDRRKRRAIEQRHRKVLERLDEHLDAERQREVRRRRGLIRLVQGLGATDDVHKAAREVRDARRSWAPTVGASRAEEGALWAEFCAACEAIENRRDAERAEADSQISEATSRRESILDDLATLTGELDALSASDDELTHHINQAQGRFDEARAAWDDAGELPRGVASRLERRFSGACDSVTAALERQRRRARDAGLDGLRARADLCGRVERLALAEAAPDAPDTADSVAQAWSRAGPVDRSCQEAIDGRYEVAMNALAGDADALAMLRANVDDCLTQRRALCLELEVLAGAESPAEDQAARMALRVQRLGRSLAEGGSDSGGIAAERRRLERAWCVCGPAAPEHADALDARFDKALTAARAAED